MQICDLPIIIVVVVAQALFSNDSLVDTIAFFSQLEARGIPATAPRRVLSATYLLTDNETDMLDQS